VAPGTLTAYDRWMWRVTLFVMVAACERDSLAEHKPAIPWPEDLIGHDELIGKTVTVDVFEPLLDAEHSSIAHGDGYTISVTDVGPKRFGLVSGAVKLPKKLRPPVRVEGTLENAPNGLQIAVSKLTALPWPTPERIKRAADIFADRKHFSRRYVELEDDYLVGFEASYLGPLAPNQPPVWLEELGEVDVHCEPTWPTEPFSEATRHRVRVAGFAFTKGSYGHLSASEGLIVATRITYLPCTK
jgi:hypothetical protein